MVVKSFRGLLADGGQDQIRLQTNNGKTGYQIVKFELMGNEPGAKSLEGSCKIYKDKQTSVDNVVNFSETALLAAAEYHKEQNTAYPLSASVIFDNQIFNQDIYVTWKDNTADEKINYYVELDVIPLTDQGAEYTTLKDIRTQLTIS
jgi:hypothetical protein